MRVLIFGGTGTMGRYLVDYLSQDNNEVYITSRNNHSSTKSNIHYVMGNAHDEEFLSKLMSNDKPWDAVVDFMIYTTTEFSDRINLLLSGTKQYVFLSSSRVYADSSDPITEDSPRLIDVVRDEKFLSSGKYAIAKAQEEDLLRNSGKNNWTIIRPYITYSNVRFQLGIYEKEDWLYRVLHGRSIVFSQDIASKMTSFTFGGDVSRGIYSILGKESALRQIFHITCDSPVKWESVLHIYKDILFKAGYEASVLYATNASEITSQEEKVKYDRLYNRIFDNSKIAQYADTSCFVKQDEGIRVCLTEFLAHPSFKAINWTTQARMDKFAHERTSLSEIASLKDKIKYVVLRYLVNYNHLKRLKGIFRKS